MFKLPILIKVFENKDGNMKIMVIEESEIMQSSPRLICMDHGRKASPY